MKSVGRESGGAEEAAKVVAGYGSHPFLVQWAMGSTCSYIACCRIFLSNKICSVGIRLGVAEVAATEEAG